MKSGGYLIVMFLILSLSEACDRKEEALTQPLILVKVTPETGNTLRLFTFDLAGSASQTNRSSRLFSRWDWDGDGIWDTPLTRMTQYEHRYYAPGTWHARVEMVNIDGGTDTTGVWIPVVRGYSPPLPFVKAEPDQGHICTEFILDASQTHDDEDSLNQLTFQWDFEGDGIWDTKKLDTARILHVYPLVGIYQARVMVEDPSGLMNMATISIPVTMTDHRLKASFIYSPDSVTDNTPITFDASASIDLDHPYQALKYRWDWNNDQVWDTEWLGEPATTHSFGPAIFAHVRLQVMSYRGLFNEMYQKIRVYHRDQPPRAFFDVSTQTGNLNTIFRFSGWPTRDDESGPSSMLYRWDYNGDGQFDTDYMTDVAHLYQYDQAGTYQVQLEVTDPAGNIDTCSKTMYVTNGSNETGMIEDTRGGGYERYGTVKIGDQWWTTRNMCLQNSPEELTFIYNGIYNNSYDYGILYGSGNVCPPGWRTPSRADWEKLFSNYPEEQLFEALMPGGESDFGATLGGKGHGTLAMDYRGRKNDAVYEWIDLYGYYWTSTITKKNDDEQFNWVIIFNLPHRIVQGRSMSIRDAETGHPERLSVRCVKDNQ